MALLLLTVSLLICMRPPPENRLWQSTLIDGPNGALLVLLLKRSIKLPVTTLFYLHNNYDSLGPVAA